MPKKSGNETYDKRQVNLDFFFVFNQDRTAYEKALKTRLEHAESQRRVHTCEACILDAVSKEPLDVRFQCRCEYRDVRDAVIGKLRSGNVIRLGWGISPDGMLMGAYSLNKQKVRKIVILRSKRFKLPTLYFIK